MRWSVALVVALALGACAGTPSWSKKGVTDQAAVADLADCNSLAQASTRHAGDIQADIMASRGHDWERSGTMDTHRAVFAAETGPQASDVLKSCMMSKGYAPGD